MRIIFTWLAAALLGTVTAQTPQPVLAPATELVRNFPRLVFSVNKARGMTAAEWTVLTRHADLVFGLDNHGHDFPGYLDDFRAQNKTTPVHGFVTAMALQRDGLNDWRFLQLDHDETAFLHCADPASLKVVVIGGVTRIFWVRDDRRTATQSLPKPIGVKGFVIESAPARSGPWNQTGSEIRDDGTTHYAASVASADTSRWYRLRTRLADSGNLTDYSWPTQPDPAPVGFAYLRVEAGPTFVTGMWGSAPANPTDVRLEWGNISGWGYPTAATTKHPAVNGITEFSGLLTTYPTSGAWVMRAHAVTQGIHGMSLQPSRRNNRILDRYGAHLFKPDHPAALAVHRRRLAEMVALQLDGMRLDFVLDSYPSWYVPALPAGEDAAWQDIEPRMLAMLQALKAAQPGMRLVLNGISVTANHTGIYDYLPPADGADCEFIGWSSPAATAPFRDAEMLDGVIGLAHVHGRPVTCYSYAGAGDIDARMTSIARYWLVFAPHVYYQFMTQDAHQSVDYFPEYDIDLGKPVRASLRSRSDLLAGSVYRRDFANGTALYNPGSSPVTVSLAEALFLVSAQGTQSPKRGGNGSVLFQGPMTSVTLAPRRGALLVKRAETGR